MQVHYSIIGFACSLALLLACAENPSNTAQESEVADTVILPRDTTLMARLVANAGHVLVNYGNTAAEDTVFNCSSTLRLLGRMGQPKKGPKYLLLMYQYEAGKGCTSKTRLLVFNEQHKLLGYYADLEATPIDIAGPAVLFKYKRGKEVRDGNFYKALPPTLLNAPLQSTEGP